MSDFRFETAPCNRCRGSGHYSRNSMGSTVCYDCNGRKARLTKRGAAAKRYALALLGTTAGELKPGEKARLRTATYGGYWARTTDPVTESGAYRVLPDGSQEPVMQVTLETSGKTRREVFSVDYPVTRVPGPAQIGAVAEYQDGLTKAGVPSKALLRAIEAGDIPEPPSAGSAG